MKRLMVILFVCAAIGIGWGAEPKTPAVVYVIGAVNKAGPVPMPKEGQLTIVEAIRLAGGANRLANLRRVVLARRNEQKELEMTAVNVEAILKKEAADVPLQSSDSVFLPESII